MIVTVAVCEELFQTEGQLGTERRAVTARSLDRSTAVHERLYNGGRFFVPMIAVNCFYCFIITASNSQMI